ncbi:MAG: hypothetical protein JXM70_17755 [Pirellulales bacterium]|nr:hypothetical protein [Pirellulales bacterium]
MNAEDIKALVQNEIVYFDDHVVRMVMQAVLVSPREVVRQWGYGRPRKHKCWVVADVESSEEMLVYCPTGFGPSFPWGRQLKTTDDMEMDGVWHAYLYEAFVSSQLWQGEIPKDFTLMGPGERKKP